MEAFDPTPPSWTSTASHSINFFCPRCGANAHKAIKVWINRRSPVISADYRRKWQEFYLCECDFVWWAWNSDRPESDLAKREFNQEEADDLS